MLPIELWMKISEYISTPCDFYHFSLLNSLTGGIAIKYNKNFRDKFTICKRYEKGEKTKLVWSLANKRHRENGPAVKIYKRGILKEDRWFRHGIWHRVDGPACIEYSSNGFIKYTEYYINGREPMCQATLKTRKGERCANKARHGETFCGRHLPKS